MNSKPTKSLPLEGGRSDRKIIQWMIFSGGRAEALDGGLRGDWIASGCT